MKKVLITALIFIYFISCSIPKDKNSSRDYNIETSDIANFWKAFDAIKTSNNKAEVFRETYLEQASEPLKKLISISGDIRNPDNYLESFKAYPKFWESARKPMLELHNISSEIDSCYEKVKGVYPDFKPADVCVFVGPFVFKGTVPPPRDVIFMGAEMNLPLSDIDLSEFEEDISFVYVNDIKSAIFDEVIHIQQKSKSTNVLSACIREGTADFLAELFLEEPYINPAYSYGRLNEHDLWEEFSNELDDPDWSKWLYGNSGNEDRPSDLGYFIGYKITKSYYEKAKDKNVAIKEIIEVTDFDEFLEESGYAMKFKK